MRGILMAMGLLAACSPVPEPTRDAETRPPAVGEPADPEAVAACGLDGRFTHQSFDGPVSVSHGEGAVLFAGPMQVNTDGAPTSYHPDDLWGTDGLAINTICNGASAVLASGERLDYRQCTRLIEAVREARAADWEGFPRIEFYGVATRNGRPCTAPSGHFVSTTALAADPSRDRCDQARYLDALTVPFIIRPGASAFTDQGMGLGDLAVTVEPRSGRMEFAVVGDIGPRRGLSEGSVFLARTLRGQATQPTTRREVAATAVPRVWTLVLTDATLEAPITTDRIRAAASAAFEAWGGRPRLDACIAGTG